MDLSALRSFVTLARVGHMTRAAAELHLTQPAVSAQLAKLEEHVGQPLFDRGPKGMTLTAAGQLYLRHVEESLAWLRRGQEALDELAGMRRGSLAIGGGATATTYLLPPLLGQFHARYPDIQLFVREQGSQSVLEGVWSGELELGVVTLPLGVPSAGAAALSRLRVSPWVDDELRLIVPASHPLREATCFTWSQLSGLPLVLFEAGSAVRAIIDQHVAQARIDARIVMELRSIESIKQMVAQGIGAAFVSRFALDARLGQGLVCQDGQLSRQLAIVWRVDRAMSQPAQVFLALMQEAAAQIQSRDPWSAR